MKSIHKIIREEYIKFLKENDDINYEYYEREDEVKQWIFSDFLYKNTPDFTKYIPWRLVPYPRLKKIWEDYIRIGIVRDTKGLEMIEDIMISNALKINILTELAGHTQNNPEEDYEENIGYWVDEQLNCILPQKPVDTSQLEIPYENPQAGYNQKEPVKVEPCDTEIHPFVQQFYNEKFNVDMDREEFREILYEEMKGKFMDYYMEDPKIGQAYISDYGLKPLVSLSYQLSSTQDSKQKITIIDKMLNIVHQRSDMASWFVQGGSRALSDLSGYEIPDEEAGGYDTKSAISGRYKMADYH
jgi:hypothetical protein